MIALELMRRAATIATKTRCWIGVGCVIARNGLVLAESWNKTLNGEEYCKKFRRNPLREDGPPGALGAHEGCVRHDLGLSQGREIEKCCSIHAEAQAVAECAKNGISIGGATMYITSFPCLICLRLLVASGIKKVVYMNDFYKPHHVEMIEENGIELRRISEKEVWK